MGRVWLWCGWGDGLFAVVVGFGGFGLFVLLCFGADAVDDEMIGERFEAVLLADAVLQVE